ncbi:hypothetical protein M9H77_31457 [Catharanthus roseus]|uniref:Uncharacterized protein n=1 Tax=Catharanthus roseus TaxID=4058 RepID=A0ACC0A163_CATRO|nr:hypothetical protein M9H77_31457 [Catharanthus roseus]
MSSVLPMCFKLNPFPTFPNRVQQPLSDSVNSVLPSAFLKSSSLNRCSLTRDSHICFSFSPPGPISGNPFNYGPQEEARWLREEQRWMREEQRWLRQESRWNSEREALLREIQSLKLRIQELESQNSVQETSASETISNIAKLLQLQVLKEGELGKTINRIPESGSGTFPFVVEAAKKEEEVLVKEIVNVPERKDKQGKKRAILRMGSEGEDVRAMQEALQKLGFYSGEEDMEFSTFSDGTQSAVKTWQATLGAREDGIMTAELLERLYMEQKLGVPSLKVGKTPEGSKLTASDKSANGAAIAAVTDISEVKETVVTEDSVSEVEVSSQRVYLLGENRWEEPSRLAGRSKPQVRSVSDKTVAKCVSCRGEGRVLCLECDGTGEPNIEPQFLEWVEEGGETAKCPYCDGLGFVTCDACEGRKLAI